MYLVHAVATGGVDVFATRPLSFHNKQTRRLAVTSENNPQHLVNHFYV